MNEKVEWGYSRLSSFGKNFGIFKSAWIVVPALKTIIVLLPNGFIKR